MTPFVLCTPRWILFLQSRRFPGRLSSQPELASVRAQLLSVKLETLVPHLRWMQLARRRTLLRVYRHLPRSMLSLSQRRLNVTAIAWGVGLSHERLDIAGAESVNSLEGNMCGTAMRGADALPGSKATSRAKGSHRKLGGLVSGRQRYPRHPAGWRDHAATDGRNRSSLIDSAELRRGRFPAPRS